LIYWDYLIKIRIVKTFDTYSVSQKLVNFRYLGVSHDFEVFKNLQYIAVSTGMKLIITN